MTMQYSTPQERSQYDLSKSFGIKNPPLPESCIGKLIAAQQLEGIVEVFLYSETLSA